jgi:hypothetical protein
MKDLKILYNLDIKKNNDRSNEIIHLIKISEARA